MEMDEVTIVYEPGKVAIIAKHGPIHVVISLSTKQAEQVAAGLLANAKFSKQESFT